MRPASAGGAGHLIAAARCRARPARPFRRLIGAAGSVVTLLLGRAVLGVGESFIITGAQSWGLAILGVQNTSKVLAWVGSAMFAAFAFGAPAGTAICGKYGFVAIALATTLLPLGTLLFVAPLKRVPSTARAHTGVMKVMAAVWVPGVASALSSIGFGAITAYRHSIRTARPGRDARNGRFGTEQMIDVVMRCPADS